MIRLALVGCTNAETPCAFAARRAAQSSVVALVDDQLDRRDSAARALGVAIAVSSFDKLLSDQLDEFDAVVIGTPDLSIIRDAVQAEKHVLAQMPLSSLNQEDLAAVFSVTRSSNVRLIVAQPARFIPAIRAVRNSCQSGELGESGLLRIHRWQTTQQGSQRGCTHQIIDDVDLAVWLFARLPSAVYAVARSRGDGEEPYHYVQIHLGFDGGGMAMIDVATQTSMGDGYYSLSLIGSNGAAYADDHHNMQLLFRDGGPLAVKTGQGQLALVAQIQEFVDAIIENRQPSVTEDDAAAAFQVAATAIESISSGRVARLVGGDYEFA